MLESFLLPWSEMDGYEFQRAELDALERVVRDASAEPMILTLPLLRHITKDFSAEFEIGKDESAVVYLGVLPSGFRIAVKKFDLHGCLDDESAFKNEVSIAMKADHKNTVRLIGYCHHTQEQIAKEFRQAHTPYRSTFLGPLRKLVFHRIRMCLTELFLDISKVRSIRREA